MLSISVYSGRDIELANCVAAPRRRRDRCPALVLGRKTVGYLIFVVTGVVPYGEASCWFSCRDRNFAYSKTLFGLGLAYAVFV